MKFFSCLRSLFLAGLIASCYPLVATSQDSPATSTYTATSEDVADAQNYVGVIYPPFPDSVVLQGSSSIYPSEYNFKWSVSRIADDRYNMLWLSQVVSHDTNGIPKHKVSDVIVLPSEEEKRVVAISTCFLSGVIDPEIVALAKWDDEVRITRFLPNKNILFDWRANQATGKFEELSKHYRECNFE
jgi:hypothetical protein